MTFLYLFNYRVVFAFHGAINNIVHVVSYHGLVGRNFYNVKIIYLTEFFFLGESRTRHTRKFVVKPEIVLESNSGERF